MKKYLSLVILAITGFVGAGQFFVGAGQFDDVKKSICTSLNTSLQGLANPDNPKAFGNKLAKLTENTIVGAPFGDILCPPMVDEAIKQISSQIPNISVVAMLNQLKKKYSCPAYLCLQMPRDIPDLFDKLSDKFSSVSVILKPLANILRNVVDTKLTPLFKDNPASIKGCANYYAKKLSAYTITYNNKTAAWWSLKDKSGNPTDPVACLPDDLKAEYKLIKPTSIPLSAEDQKELDELFS